MKVSRNSSIPCLPYILFSYGEPIVYIFICICICIIVFVIFCASFVWVFVYSSLAQFFEEKYNADYYSEGYLELTVNLIFLVCS
jgi:hypothetical protein